MEKIETNKQTDYSVFEKRNNQNLKLLNIEETKETIVQGFGNMLGTIKGYMKVNTDDEANVREQNENKPFYKRITDSILNCIEVEKSYKYFILLLTIGVFLTFFSLMFLPLVILSPSKFVSLFSLGSIIILSSFIFLHGTKDFIFMLFSKERYVYSLLYILSLCVGIYFAVINPYFIICLICAVIQLITLIIFSLSFIPGGGAGINFFLGFLWSPIKNIFNK